MVYTIPLAVRRSIYTISHATARESCRRETGRQRLHRRGPRPLAGERRHMEGAAAMGFLESSEPAPPITSVECILFERKEKGFAGRMQRLRQERG